MPPATVARLSARASETIADHRIAAFVITSATLVLAADAVRRVLPEETSPGVGTWVLLGLMAPTVIVAVALRERVQPERRALFTFTLGIAPALYGFAGTLTGSPPLLMWAGVVVSVSLVALALATSQRAEWVPH
jgi:hypothetical protein